MVQPEEKIEGSADLNCHAVSTVLAIGHPTFISSPELSHPVYFFFFSPHEHDLVVNSYRFLKFSGERGGFGSGNLTSVLHVSQFSSNRLVIHLWVRND